MPSTIWQILAIAALATAAFEIEASEAQAAKLGRASRGITIPTDVMKRDLNVGTATAGGNLVETELDAANFIDLLRNASALDQAGATVLTGLSSNVNIPRQSGAATQLTGLLNRVHPPSPSRPSIRSL